MAELTEDQVHDLRQQREVLRSGGDYKAADVIRKQLETAGYVVNDTELGSVVKRRDEVHVNQTKKLLAVFGSGESASTGRAVHEYLVADLLSPVTIGLLETPTGYEDNPDKWYVNLAAFLEKGLANHQPQLSLIPAYRSDIPGGTNDPQTLEALNQCDYIHTGAGSPTYALRHLKDSLVLTWMKEQIQLGTPLSLASAASCAFGKLCLPVYELYYAGHEPYWEKGLDFFGEVMGLNISFMPHWNNTEGGNTIDTRFTYMGKKRFTQLLSIMPCPTTIVGIDEHTALIFDLDQRQARVMGKGGVTILTSKATIYEAGSLIPSAAFMSPTMASVTW